ncbi:major facilitator superfamily domain-containing protein [Blastocladiella britannica]|nr:major facilitator superfamily domain-containing protein [Blastocladiella britannica]
MSHVPTAASSRRRTATGASTRSLAASLALSIHDLDATAAAMSSHPLLPETTMEEEEEDETAPLSMPSPTPLPARPITVLAICILSEPVSLGLLFPFVYFMVRDFKVVDNDANLGYYVGFLASAFSLAQFLTSVPWGMASDRIGRRPILLVGLLGNTLSMVAFGMSSSFPMAIACRLICGMLNGNLGVAKCVLGELCDDSNQDRGFALFGIAWGIGGIVGPMIGGLLADPAHQYPNLFGDCSFLVQYPYALPCMVSALVSLVGFVAGLVFLDETHPDLRTPRLASAHLVEAPPQVMVAGGESAETLITTTAVHHHDPKHDDDDIRITDEETPLLPTPDTNQLDDPYRPVLFGLGWSSIHAVTGYALVALHTTLFDEVFALWAVQPVARGGLRLVSVQVGGALAAMGVAELAIVLLVYPAVARRVTLRRLYAAALAVFPVAYLAFPLVAAVVRARFGAQDADGGVALVTTEWALLLAAMLVRLLSSCLTFTPIMCMVRLTYPQL